MGPVDGKVAELLDQLNVRGPGVPARTAIVGELVSLLAPELRHRASGLLARERSGHVLQTTALFNEGYLRLVRSRLTFQDRQIFLAMASRIMRQILVDLARSANPLNRRAGVTALDFDSAEQAAALDPATLLDLNAAIETLSDYEANIVDLLFFTGLSQEETAELLEISYETLRKHWYAARRKLYTILQRKKAEAG